MQALGSATSWTAASNQPWLTLSQTSGTNSGSIDVTANATSLAAGTHTAQLDGLKALSYLGANGVFSDGVEVLDANNGLVHTFEQLQSIAGVRFSADDRFLVVIGNSQSAAGDLQVLKIP